MFCPQCHQCLSHVINPKKHFAGFALPLFSMKIAIQQLLPKELKIFSLCLPSLYYFLIFCNVFKNFKHYMNLSYKNTCWGEDCPEHKKELFSFCRLQKRASAAFCQCDYKEIEMIVGREDTS